MNEQKIICMLRSLGITRCYRGTSFALAGIQLVLENEDCLQNVIRDIYCVIAQRHQCNWHAVERSLRTVIRRAWQINPQLLCAMAGYPLDGPPSASQFLEIAASCLLRQEGRSA